MGNCFQIVFEINRDQIKCDSDRNEFEELKRERERERKGERGNDLCFAFKVIYE
jgi:hypothetical protein